MLLFDKILFLIQLKIEEWNLRFDERIVKKVENNDFLEQQLETKKMKVVKKREDYDNQIIDVDVVEDTSYVSIGASDSITNFELPMMKKKFDSKSDVKSYHDYKIHGDEMLQGGHGNSAVFNLNEIEYIENRLIVPGVTNMLTVKHFDNQKDCQFKFFVDQFGLYLNHKLDRFEINHRITWTDIYSNTCLGFNKHEFWHATYSEFPKPIIECIENGIGEIRLVINARYAAELSCDSVLSTVRSDDKYHEPTSEEIQGMMQGRTKQGLELYSSMGSEASPHLPLSSLKPRKVKDF